MPWRRPDGGLDITGPLHVSDRPIYLDALGELVIGHLVGILDMPAYGVGKAVRL
jgi:hypothetical protein